MSNGLHPDFVCPDCHFRLADFSGALRCGKCESVYPVEDEITDFSRGRYYDNFVPGQALTAEHREGLEEEVAGAVSRIQDFYLPLLRRYLRRGSSGAQARVLDCGCGNGLSVDLLNDAGFVAFGNDPSALRKWQWKQRQYRRRLVVADGSKLPFPGGFFEAVVSSGVLEHVGVVESAVGSYRVEPAPDRDERRKAFLLELLRVLSPQGRLWIDFPNGAFPVDFWHGTTSKRGARWHSRREGFLPTLHEVRGYVAQIAPGLTVRAVGPHRRLRLHRIRKHVFGRLLNLPARALLWTLSLPGARAFAGSSLNPFLVLEIRRGSAPRRPEIHRGRKARSRKAGSRCLRIEPSAVGKDVDGKIFAHERRSLYSGWPARTSHAVVPGFQDQVKRTTSPSRFQTSRPRWPPR